MSNVINFYETDFNILNPRRNFVTKNDSIYRLEFPIMQWLFAGIYKLFGNHILIARLLTFLISLITLFNFYILLKYLFKAERLALIGAWALNFSPAFYYYAVSPMPDNFALCCSLGGLAIFIKNIPKNDFKSTFAAAFLIGLGVATKLPFILFYAVPFAYYIQKIFKKELLLTDFFKGLIWLSLLVPALVWYAYAIPEWDGQDTTFGILSNFPKSTELLDILIHNFFSSLPELIIGIGTVPFFIAGFYFMFKRKAYQNTLFYPFLFWAFMTLLYFFFELNIIQKVHDYYLFPFYPLIFIIVAYGAHHLLYIKKIKSIAFFLILTFPIFALARIQGRWNVEEPRFNKVILSHKDELQTLSNKEDLIIVGNDASYAIFFYHLDRKGWAFAENRLSVESLESMINQGAKYLYSDAEIVNNNPAIKAIIGNPIYEVGTLKVYELKNKK